MMMIGVPNPERHDDDTAFGPEDLWAWQFERLSAFLDGELTQDEARAVEDWLTSDAEAQSLYRQLCSIQAGLDCLPLAPDTGSIETMISTVIGQAQPHWRYRILDNILPQTHKVAAAVVMLLGLGMSTFQQWSGPQLLVSIETPPVEISSLSPSARVAEQYLLIPSESQDPYTILFSEGSVQ